MGSIMTKIKQQKAINTFLIEELGKDRGNALLARQEKALAALIEGEEGRSQSQVKTLTQRIFPCLALYKALFEDGFSKDDGYEYTRKYMLNKVARPKHSSTAKMELIPGFYRIYSNVFLKVMRTADLWESTQNMAGHPLTSQSINAFGTRHVWKMTVQSCAACFVMRIM